MWSCISLSGLSGRVMPWTKGFRYSSIEGVYTALTSGRGEVLTKLLRSNLLSGLLVAVSRKADSSSLASQREFGDRISPSVVSVSMFISFILFSLRVLTRARFVAGVYVSTSINLLCASFATCLVIRHYRI